MKKRGNLFKGGLMHILAIWLGLNGYYIMEKYTLFNILVIFFLNQ